MDHLDLLYKPAKPAPEDTVGRLNGRLVIVSNRVACPASAAGRAPAAGGLAVALQSVLKAHGGLWFGWSGEAGDASGCVPRLSTHGGINFAVTDL